MELHENKKLFADAVLAAAESFNINAVYIEKDYWITRSLRLLSKNVNAQNVVFKGGTSLSKAYHIVNRFSEDIDIAVVDADSMNGNQVKTLIKRVAKEMTAGLEEVSTDGITSKGSRYYKALYRYPNKLGKTLNATVNVGQLLVEVNSFSNPYPHEKKTITSFIAEFLEKTGNQHLIKEYGLQSFSLNVLDKRRTMAEKLVSIVRFSFSDNYLYDVASKIRHFYDLHYLASDADCANYMQSTNFKTDFEALLAHDQQTFDTPDGWKMKKVSDSPLITDFPNSWKSLCEKYKTELPAIAYAAIPDEKLVAESFEKIIEQLNYSEL